MEDINQQNMVNDMLAQANVQQDPIQEFKDYYIQVSGGDSLPEHNKQLLMEQLDENEPLIELAQYIHSIYKPEDNAPGYNDLVAWKNNFKRIYLTTVVEPDDLYIFRPMVRLEYKKFVNECRAADEFQRQEYILNLCLLYPKPEVVFYERPAGYASALETKIMYQSGFLDDASLLSTIKVIK